MRKINENTIKNIVKEAVSKIMESFETGISYDIVNKKNSTYGNISTGWNNRRIERTNENTLYVSENLNEAIDWQVDTQSRGGIIVFSTDVNAIQLSQNKLLNYCKTKLATFLNRINATKKVDRIANKHSLVGWTLGHYLDGRYKAKNGKNFGEKSLSVEIIGVDSKTLIKIAEDICADFMQEAVLCKDYSTGNIYFVNPS